jgi:thioesterase-3
LSVDIRVRGYHLDVYQHVNNGRYMEFLEEARWDFMGKTGFTEQLEGLGRALVVVNININYRRPALLNDLLRVSVRLSKIGNKSAQFEQVVTRIVDGEEQDVVADAMVTFCVMDPDAEKAVVLEGDIRSILEKAMEY